MFLCIIFFYVIVIPILLLIFSLYLCTATAAFVIQPWKENIILLVGKVW
jgi:hypothetical protein